MQNLKELGIKQLKRLPLGTKVFIGMTGVHWIKVHQGLHQGMLTKDKDNRLAIQTRKFIIPVIWKSDVPTLSFKIYQ